MKDAAPTDKLPVHEATYRRLRDMVLFGDLAPGQRVTIQGLTVMLGAGMTPVREAIRRLTAEGALILHENRRVSVPVLTAPQVAELGFARLAIEPHLAELAAARVDDALLAALAAIDAQVDTAIAQGDVGAYLEANYRFHFALYERAAAPILTNLAQGLWLRFGPSLRLVIIGQGNIGPDRHKDALAALRLRAGKAAAAAIHGDIAQGIDRVQAVMKA